MSCNPWGCEESNITEQHTHTHTHVEKSKKLLIETRIKITKVTTTKKEHQEVPPKC